MAIRSTLLSALLVAAFCMPLGSIRADQDADSDAADEVTPIAQIDREEPVDFESEILPLLRQNCLACHSESEAYGDVVLETPETILKGGASGEIVVAGSSAESPLLEILSGAGEPVMPPEDNDVGARRLTSEELGLIKLWIDQGATGEVMKAAALAWQPLPPGVNPIYAVALSPDGQFAACGRANQIFMYHLPTGRLVGRLTDPALVESELYQGRGVAHLDLVQSLAFNPSGELLASGGYREIKLWRRPKNVERLQLAAAESPQTAIATTADGTKLATGGEDGRIRLVDLSSGEETAVLDGHTAAVTALCFTPDGARLVSSSDDQTVRTWNVADAEVAETHELPAPARDVVVTGDDAAVVAACADGVIRILGGAEDAPREISGHEGPVHAVAILPGDEGRILTGGEDGTLRLWNLASGEELKKLDHGAPVTAVAARPDGSRLASAGANQLVRLWNAEDDSQLADIKGDVEARRKVDQIARVTGRVKAQLDSYQSAFDTATKDAEEKSTAATAAAEAHVAAVDAAKEAQSAAETAQAERVKAVEAAVAAEVLAKQTAEMQEATEKANTAATEVAKLATEALANVKKAVEAQRSASEAASAAQAAAVALAEAGGDDEEIAAAKQTADALAAAAKAADQAAQAALAALDAANTKRDTAAKEAAARLGEAQKAAAEAAEAVTTTAEAKTAAEKTAEEKAAAAKTAADAVEPAKRAADQSDAAAKRANTTVANLQQTLEGVRAAHEQVTAMQTELEETAAGFEQTPRSLAFSPDGLLLAVAGDNARVSTYRAEDGAPIESLVGHEAAVPAVTFVSPSTLASVSADASTRLWELYGDWQLVKRFGPAADDPLDVSASPLVDRVITLDFSPDGRLLAAAGGEPSRGGELQLWDLAEGTLVRDWPEAHTDTVFSVRFSPDGKYLATASADKFVKVFRVDDGEFVKAFEGHTHHVLGVAWNQDGKLLASCGADDAVKVWNFASGEQQRTIGGFGKQVTAIDFVADGAQIVTSAGDRAVRTHNTGDGKATASYTGSSDYLYTVAITPDGAWIAAGGQDSTLRLWKTGEAKPAATFEPPAAEEIQQAQR